MFWLSDCRSSIASTLLTLHEWLLRSIPTIFEMQSTLRNAFVTNHAYTGLRLPVRPTDDASARFMVNFSARYLSEDVPYGLIVLGALPNWQMLQRPTLIGWLAGRRNAWGEAI